VEVLATLQAHTVFVCERPAEDRKKLRSVQVVMDAFPDVRLVIDAKNSASSGPVAVTKAATVGKSLSTPARKRRTRLKRRSR